MKISDVVKVDSGYRTHRKIVSLANSIAKRLDYHYRNSPTDIRHVHVQRARSAIAWLTLWAEQPAWEINSYLSSRKIVIPPVKEVLDEIFEGLRPPSKAQLEPFDQAIFATMTQIGREARASQYKTILQHEVAYRAKQNWFILFNTLTVRDGEYTDVFHKDSTAFKDYIRRVDRAIRASCNIKANQKTTEEYHTYLATVEEGSKTGRLHIHILHFMKQLPKGHYDPNTAKTLPKYRELDCMRKYWPHGNTTPIMVRYSPTDAYGREGYRWPFDTKKNKPTRVNNPLRVATYVAKYITKSYTSKKRSQLLWRVKKTQNLGLQITTELLSTLTREHLINVATCNSLNPKINQRRLPPNLIKLQALRLFRDRYSTKHELSLTRAAQNMQPQDNLLQRVRGSTQTMQTRNQLNSTTSLIQNIADTGTFDDTWQELKKHAERINAKYFKQPRQEYGSASIGDHIFPKIHSNTQTNRDKHSD